MNHAITSPHWRLGLARLRDAGRHAALACEHLGGGLGHLTAGLVDALVLAPLARWVMAGLAATWRAAAALLHGAYHAVKALVIRALPVLFEVLSICAAVAIVSGVAWAVIETPEVILPLAIACGVILCAYLVWTYVPPILAPLARACLAALRRTARGLARLALRTPRALIALLSGGFAAFLFWRGADPLAWIAPGVLALLAVLIRRPAPRGQRTHRRPFLRLDRLARAPAPAFIFIGAVIAIGGVLWWALSNPMDAGVSAIVLSALAGVTLAVVLLVRLGHAVIRLILLEPKPAFAPAPQERRGPFAAEPSTPAPGPNPASIPPRSRSPAIHRLRWGARSIVLIVIGGGLGVIRAAVRAARQTCAATLRWVAGLRDAVWRRLVNTARHGGAVLQQRSRIAWTVAMVGLIAAFLGWRQPGSEGPAGEANRPTPERGQPANPPAPVVFSATGAVTPIAFAVGYRDRLEGESALVDADTLSVGDVCRHSAIAAVGAASSDGAARANEALARHRALVLAAIVQRAAASCPAEARPSIIAVSHGEAIGPDMRDQRRALATSNVASALVLRTDASRVEACLVQTGSRPDHPALGVCPNWSMVSNETETE